MENVPLPGVRSEKLLHLPVIGYIDIRGDGVNMLQKVLPEAKCLCYRAARGIVRTRYVGVHLAKPYVYVHGEVKYPLAGLGDIVDVVRDMIRGEKLRGVEAEGLLPCAVRADELCSVGRNAPLEKFGRLRRIVPCRADKSRLVFDLDADNAAVRVIAGYVSAQLGRTRACRLFSSPRRSGERARISAPSFALAQRKRSFCSLTHSGT